MGHLSAPKTVTMMSGKITTVLLLAMGDGGITTAHGVISMVVGQGRPRTHPCSGFIGSMTILVCVCPP